MYNCNSRFCGTANTCVPLVMITPKSAVHNTLVIVLSGRKSTSFDKYGEYKSLKSVKLPLAILLTFFLSSPINVLKSPVRIIAQRPAFWTSK